MSTTGEFGFKNRNFGDFTRAKRPLKLFLGCGGQACCIILAKDQWISFSRNEAENAGQRIRVKYAEVFEIVKWLDIGWAGRRRVDNKTIKNILYWTLPQGLVDVAKKTYYRLLLDSALKLCRGNCRYRDIHRGKRCFIVCNGPSVNRQNLLPLKDEIVFSVSSGYHHKDYAIYRPRYHCTPQLAFTQEVAIAWFREMHEKIGDAELFLSYREEPLVRENHLFSGRKVNYLCMHDDFNKDSTQLVDITKIVPGVCSVAIMCLMIAMYMGFKDIYLLGTDHDSYRTGEYKYFYNPTLIRGNVEELIDKDFLYELYSSYLLFIQFRTLRKIAHAHGINIYNATAGGALEEFERVSLDDVLKG